MILLLQVVSPITGQEIGMQEIRVAKNRETIRGMTVRILTGLGLDVQADPVRRGRYVLKTSYSQLLSSKYQVSAIVSSVRLVVATHVCGVEIV